jgi:hypothetical protein
MRHAHELPAAAGFFLKEQDMAPTTSDLIVERLPEWGVDTYFGLPGDGINGEAGTHPVRVGHRL